MALTSLTEVHLRPGGAVGPRPVFKPALEVLEERIVLSGAATPVSPKAAAGNPDVAAQKVLNLSSSSVGKFLALQNNLVALTGQANNIPLGPGRDRVYSRGKSQINKFLSGEQKRFKKFQTLKKGMGASLVFSTAAELYQQIHQYVLSAKSEIAEFRKICNTKVIAPSPKRENPAFFTRSNSIGLDPFASGSILKAAKVAADSNLPPQVTVKLFSVIGSYFSSFLSQIQAIATITDPLAAFFAVAAILPKFNDPFEFLLEIGGNIVNRSDIENEDVLAGYGQLLALRDQVISAYSNAQTVLKKVIADYRFQEITPAHQKP